jgi:biopolymer transport protein ExbD
MAGSQNIGEASDNPVAINVTAMVDVIFCLCIFFMCSFHFKQLEGRIESWLPKEERGIVTSPDPPLLLTDEIRVVMTWDAGTNTTHRKVERSDRDWVRSDQELVRDIVGMAEGFKKVNNTTYRVIVDSQGDVPWRDVVHVMDLCRQNQLDRIEFSAPEQVITPAAPPGSG